MIPASTRSQVSADTQALYWFRKAAEQDYAVGQFGVGNMYFRGEGVPQDYAKAIELFTRAAEQGLRVAEYQLGVAHDTGQGVPQDDELAFEWYRRAAEQGMPEARYRVGIMYEQGRGVEADFSEGRGGSSGPQYGDTRRRSSTLGIRRM